LRENCDIIKDLIPVYLENLTSEESNQLIKEHLHSCEDCANYHRSAERDLPAHDFHDVGEEQNEQKLVKGIQRRLNKSRFIAILVGILIGISVSLMLFNSFLVVIVLSILTVIYLLKAGGDKITIEYRGGTIAIFVLSFLSLVISLKLFWNTAIYVDDFGTSPAAVYGGDFWLYMAWLQLPLLAIVTLVSGIKLVSKK
jgi:hypothetical protein